MPYIKRMKGRDTMEKTTYRAYISVLKEGAWFDFTHDLSVDKDNAAAQGNLRAVVVELFNLEDFEDHSVTLMGV